MQLVSYWELPGGTSTVEDQVNRPSSIFWTSVLGLNQEFNNVEARTWDRVFIATHLCMKYWPKATCIEMNKNSFIMYPNEDVRWKMLKLNSNIWWPFNSFDILKILSADKLIHNWIAEMYLIWNCPDRKLTEKYHWKHHHKRLQTVCPNNCFHTTRHGIYHSFNGFSFFVRQDQRS